MARTAAAAIARADLAAACPAPEKLAQEEPALQLSEDVLQLARRLTAVAEQSIARVSAYSPSTGSFEVRLRSLCSALYCSNPPAGVWSLTIRTHVEASNCRKSLLAGCLKAP